MTTAPPEPLADCPVCREPLRTRIGMICSLCYLRALQRRTFKRTCRKQRLSHGWKETK